MPIVDVLTSNATNWPDLPAVVAGDVRMSFRALQEQVWRLANGLAGLASPGERVAILAQNGPAYVEALYGVPSAGLVLTLLNYRLNPKEWAWILDDADARVLIVERQYLDAVRAVLGDAGSVEHVIVIDEGLDDRGVLSYEELKAGAAVTPPDVAVAEEDVACLIYTSGTTGFPKGTMISHRALRMATVSNAMEMEIQPRERFLMTFPMCHAAGFQTYVLHHRACEVVLMPAFAPDDFLRLVEEHRITRTALAPTMASFVLDHPALDRTDVSSMRVVGYGGMPMPVPTARRLAERFGDLASGFGQSETTLLVTALSIADHRRALDGEQHLLESCGRPIGLAAIEVLDDDASPCPPGEVGELCVRSDLTMSGYWNNPEGTAAAFSGGWLHTGDLVRRDDDGYLYIVDRKKDLVISGGQNIYPTEVERVIYQLAGVAEVAVVGVGDPVWGESLVAVVVARPGIPIAADEIIYHCRDNLASYKKPSRVVFLDELPKNVTGKILKRELRATLARSATESE